jgi:putative membrane protein
MIVYDSHHPVHFLRRRGSVLPRASCFAFCSAALALLLKLLEQSDVLKIHASKLVSDNAAFAMYTTTLAFLLVFRTGKCYSRFWHCATSCCTLRAQWIEAASSLICFTFMSTAREFDIEAFKKSVVSLTSLLHAAALGHVCSCSLERFEVIGWNSLDVKFRSLLAQQSLRGRVDLVYMWLNGLVVKHIKNGLLNIPPPILSRVFQEMEKGMVEYNQVLEVMTIPFPFPYAQTSYFLLILFQLFAPFAMCSWTDHWVSCTFLTFITVMCLTSLEIISTELENPFGHDDNDLPVAAFQDAINETLTLVLGRHAQDRPDFYFADANVVSKEPVANLSAAELRSITADVRSFGDETVKVLSTGVPIIHGKGAFGNFMEVERQVQDGSKMHDTPWCMVS